LLLDEIAGGLTEGECQELEGAIKGVIASGVAIVWIEHLVHVLIAVVDRLLVINFGKHLAEGEPHAVMADPAVQEVYMGIEAE
jgi:branched-chain amino acid transport system ATP-binding protein